MTAAKPAQEAREGQTERRGDLACGGATAECVTAKKVLPSFLEGLALESGT